MSGPPNRSVQVVVAKLTSKSDADLSQRAADKADMLVAIKGRKAKERLDLFEDGLVNRLIDKGKIKLNQDVIRRLIDSYRA